MFPGAREAQVQSLTLGSALEKQGTRLQPSACHARLGVLERPGEGWAPRPWEAAISLPLLQPLETPAPTGRLQQYYWEDFEKGPDSRKIIPFKIKDPLQPGLSP